MQIVQLCPGALAGAHLGHRRLVALPPFAGKDVPVLFVALRPEKHFRFAGNAVAPIHHRAEHIERQSLYVRKRHVCVPPLSQPGGATDRRPTTPSRSMKLATIPARLVSSTKAFKNPSPAAFFFGVPTACCTAGNWPSRMREPCRACATCRRP